MTKQLALHRILLLMSNRRKKQGLVLILLTAIGAVLEVVSLAALFPVLAYILDPAVASGSKLMQHMLSVSEYFPFDERFVLGITFAVVIIVASAYRVVLVWVQVVWGNSVGHDFSALLFRRSIDQNYERHIVRNTSEIVSGITLKVNQLVGSYINPLVAILSSLILLFSIVGALIYISGIAVVILIGLIACTYALITFTIRRKLAFNSQIISERSNSIVKQVQESFQGIRDVILSGTQDKHVQVFSRLDYEFRSAQSSSTVLSQSPRYLVESILVVSLVGVALYNAGDLTLSGDLLPSLGVIALGVQRVMPLAQVIYANVATMKGASVSVEDVVTMASEASSTDKYDLESDNTIEFTESIQFNEVIYRYPEAKDDQLSGINLAIHKGSCVGFLGATGSGKSTLLDILCGLLTPASGSLQIDGLVLSHQDCAIWRRKLAVVSQNTYFNDSSIFDNIVQSDPCPDEEKVRSCLQVAQLMNVIEGLPDGLNTSVGEGGVSLSGGQLQRLSIARALYRNSEVLIFDEATSALDQATEKRLMNALKEFNKTLTVVLVAHRLNTLADCDVLYRLEKGQIVASGSYQELVLGEEI